MNANPRGECGLSTPFDLVAGRGMAILAMLSSRGQVARATKEDLPRAAFDGGQEPFAELETAQGVQQVELWLPFHLHPFGFGEQLAGFSASARLLQGIRRRASSDHSQERITALFGVANRLAGIGYRVSQPA